MASYDFARRRLMDIRKIQNRRDSVCYDGKTVGAALLNTGNSCFSNAVLQCLVHTVPLVLKLRELDHYDSCPGFDDQEFCSLCALKNHIDMSLYMSGYVIAARRFSDNMNKISGFDQLGQQEDAQEFFQGLLNSLDTACEGDDQTHGTIIKQIFGGSLRSKVMCCECNRISESFEPLLGGLSLAIGMATNLIDVLGSFTAVEHVDVYACESCKAKGSVVKCLKLDQAPQVLALHLKRFNNRFQKINAHVEFPWHLNVNPFMCSPGPDQVYDLYAMIVHEGRCECGHYISLVRSSKTSWHKFDDHQVRKVGNFYVGNQDAYMLFYIKRNTAPWFSYLMSREPTLASGVPIEDNVIPTLEYASTPSSSSVTSISSSENHEAHELGVKYTIDASVSFQFDCPMAKKARHNHFGESLRHGQPRSFSPIHRPRDRHHYQQQFSKKMENVFEKNREIIEDRKLGMEPGLSPRPCKIQCLSLDDNNGKDSIANQQTDQHNGTSNSGGVGGEGEKHTIPPKTTSTDQTAFIDPLWIHHGSPNTYDVNDVVADKDSENQEVIM